MENLVWTFASEAVSLDDLPSDNPLAGPLVIGGTLTAEATVNGVDGILQSVSLSVNPRQLHWQELSFKNDRHSALMKDGGQDTPPAGKVAWLCSIDYQDCSSYGGLGQKWIWPDFQAVTPLGVTISQIQGEGPNAGLWWFPSISYQIRSGWNMNDKYLPGAPTVVLGDSIQWQQCITYGVPGPPVNVNWYGFNRVCKQVEAVEGFEDKARQHEEGHWDQLHSAAQNWPLYNPHSFLEAEVAQGALGWSQLEDLVRNELPIANEGLHLAAVPEPPQVFSAHVWFLEQGSNPLRFYGPQFWQW